MFSTDFGRTPQNLLPKYFGASSDHAADLATRSFVASSASANVSDFSVSSDSPPSSLAKIEVAASMKRLWSLKAALRSLIPA
ncbi:MAG: hypothetical protein WA705_02020 [Candidatus Ozemobacteraceae bacterium]